LKSEDKKTSVAWIIKTETTEKRGYLSDTFSTRSGEGIFI
jgi:hypothetical protein